MNMMCTTTACNLSVSMYQYLIAIDKYSGACYM